MRSYYARSFPLPSPLPAPVSPHDDLGELEPAEYRDGATKLYDRGRVLGMDRGRVGGGIMK